MIRTQPRTEEELRRELDERTADLRRVKAEYDNYRKRVRRDRVAVREVAVANVLRGLLPVLDVVDRAQAHEPMTPGLTEIIDTLDAQVGALGLQAFGAEGDLFDPEIHEALSHRIEPGADHLVCAEVLRLGYRVGDQLLRPASVAVAGPSPPPRGGDPDPRSRGPAGPTSAEMPSLTASGTGPAPDGGPPAGPGPAAGGGPAARSGPTEDGGPRPPS